MHTTTDDAALPDWATLPSTSTTEAGVLRDFARDTLKHMEDADTVAPGWGAEHPLLIGTGPISAADVLNLLDDGCREHREQAARMEAVEAP